MSAIVGPSQRVCSSPTLVSTWTFERDHVGGVVAPAEPGLDHRDLDLARGELGVRGGGQRLELRHAVVAVERAVDELGGARGALDRGGERGRLEVGVVDPDPLGERDQVRRQVGAGAQPVPARIAAIIRVVEDLPLVPTTWIESNRRSGWPSAVISRRMRSRPKRIPNSSSDSR